ncbi:MAG: hypothetical protein VXZ82_20510 [Planctomycetota bacterium]|nr:hypothetical protein [Planctomycetota bacterium]
MRIPRATITYLWIASAILASVGISETRAGSPLCEAASQYNEAVRHFEIAIYERGSDHYSKRLVQRLEDAAIEMRSASHQPNQLDRLVHAWEDIQLLHPRMEAYAFRARNSCQIRPDARLQECWERVNCAYRDLGKEIACLLGEHPQQTLVPRWLPNATTGIPGAAIPQQSFRIAPQVPTAPPTYTVPAVPTAHAIPQSLNRTLPQTFVPTTQRYVPTSGIQRQTVTVPALPSQAYVPRTTTSRAVPFELRLDDVRLRPSYRSIESRRPTVDPARMRTLMLQALLGRATEFEDD